MCHLLVIKDEPLIAVLAADIAESGGATSTVLAESEETAMIAAREMVPNVIVSDVDLTEGGRGPIAAAVIRAEFSPVPVIFVTGTPEVCEPCDYAHAILAKPMNEAAFLHAFTRWARHSSR